LLGRKPQRAQNPSPHRLPHALQRGFPGLKDSTCGEHKTLVARQDHAHA